VIENVAAVIDAGDIDAGTILVEDVTGLNADDFAFGLCPPLAAQLGSDAVRRAGHAAQRKYHAPVDLRNTPKPWARIGGPIPAQGPHMKSSESSGYRSIPLL
jgi:hypothetical protein